MKRGMLILLLSCMPVFLYGKRDYTDFTFGAEWSYCATFLSGYRFYFIAPEGYRVDDRKDTTGYANDGEVYAHAGYNINQHWNLSLYIGYTGIGDYHNGVPISLRATRYFGAAPLRDRWFAYCDIGSGVALKSRCSELITGKIGGGYRISLSRITKLDFIASIRFMHTHPEILYYGEFIEESNIGRASGYVMSASVGIGLTF
jgi:hypothetical protein